MTWLVIYTSGILFDSVWVYSDRNSFEYLLSTAHLSQPLGWLFLLSLLFTFIGLTIRAYISFAGY